MEMVGWKDEYGDFSCRGEDGLLSGMQKPANCIFRIISEKMSLPFIPPA